ncbi:MAG TPA: class I SAM-dependent methyltransferase [Campylobacterales bacterium]|nr:class I SAM-dependent methyltransferase [Campylobacterales bacterium]
MLKTRQSEKLKSEFKFLDNYLKYLPKDMKILDVGCGYGEKLIHIHDKNYDVLGVEKNKFILNEMKNKGYNVLNLEEFEAKKNKKYDLIIMSHIIEHFDYESLKEFMEYYLQFLKNGGDLMIFTPTLSKDFYVDFDHVKPYHPQGIKVLFDGSNFQLQFYSKYKLKLIEFRYRKSPIFITYTRRQLLGQKDRLTSLINLFSLAIFKLSFKTFAKTTGWMGVYKKVEDS